MKRTYTPSLEELDRQHGERYYTVTITKDGAHIDSALQFGTLESIIGMMDCTLESVDPEGIGDEYGARISYGTRDLIIMPNLMGPDSAQVLPQPTGDTYDIRQVDAWHDGEGWTYNESWHLTSFTTTGDPARAFRRALARLGITFYRGRTATEYDGDVFEIVDRATREPLFCAIPQEV